MNSNGSTPAPDQVNLADYVTSEDAAEISGYHVNYIRRLLRKGRLKGRKFGNVWWIERESLQEYMVRIEALGSQKFVPDRYREQ